MKQIALVILVGASLLTAVPTYPLSWLSLSCTTKGLTPGSRVLVEVQPEYQPQAVGKSYKKGIQNVGAPQLATTQHAWHFVVPASGVVSPSAHLFEFPTGVAARSSDHFGSVYLKIRFKVDDPRRTGERGYGKVRTVIFGMPARAGVNLLSRCLRFRPKNRGLRVEMAEDCRDATFAAAARREKFVPGSTGPPSKTGGP